MNDSHNTKPQDTAIEVARTGEHQANAGHADPFPPEGTDEKLLETGNNRPRALSESDRVKATRAAIASEGKPTLEKP